MSGLGTTVDPSGEPGTQTSASIPQSETLPDQPGSIRQSTAIQTLDQLLHTNWIYDSTFTAATTMPAGTILFTKPIHPMEWNWPNRRVSSMFNLWTGSGKIRYRPLATAWYGGSIRVGFLPPNLTLQEINNMPLEVLTSYPNKDIDPKNTAWVDFRGPDQREIAYHYMAPFDDSDRQNFGGYIVFYVAGKLVTQAPEFTTIQFIVELAGDFMYDQPSPRALVPSAAIEQPLGSAVLHNLFYQPICDSLDSGRGNVVQVCASSIVSLSAGGGTMSSVGVPQSLLKNVEGLDPLTFRAQWAAITSKPSTYSSIQSTGGLLPNIHTYTNSVPHSNREYRDELYVINAANPSTDPAAKINIKFFKTSNTGSTPFSCSVVPDGNEDVLQNDLAIPGDIRIATMSSTTPINPALTPANHMKLTPQAAGESIVIFGNLDTRQYAPQTICMSEELGNWPKDQSADDISWLYNLVNKNGTPLMTIRLNPNGMFTTNATTSPVLYTASFLLLKYFGTLPLSSPLPGPTASQKNLQRILARHGRLAKPNRDDMDFEIEIM